MTQTPADEPLAVQVLSATRLAGDFRPLERIEVEHASLTGGPALRVRREILRAGRAAVIIPFDSARGRIVVVRQFRIGAALATPHAAPLELPAGLVDAGESARQAAERELAEETGLRAAAIEEAFTILSSPGLSDERVSVFLALVDSMALPARGGVEEESEDIHPLAFDADALIEAADAGRIENGFLFASLQWFARRGRALAEGLANGMRGD